MTRKARCSRKAMELNDDELVRLNASSGIAEDCRKKFEECNRSACTCPILYPLGDDVEMMIYAFSQT
jgi:5,10-methylenetetrahydromethanopterin reductase